jgi:hypothetical protein
MTVGPGVGTLSIAIPLAGIAFGGESHRESLPYGKNVLDVMLAF